MAEARTVATLFKDVERKVASARPTATWVFNSVFQSHEETVFQSLEETLASMKPMVREIDQSNREIIQLLEELIDHLRDFRSNVAWYNPHKMPKLKRINEELNTFLLEYVQLSLSNRGAEVNVLDLPEKKLWELVTRLMGMLVVERHSAAESTKFVFQILELTLDVLDRQLASGELKHKKKHLSLLKRVEVLVRFHRGQYGIDIPEFLKELERQLRRLLPAKARQPLDNQIQELKKNYDAEQEKKGTKHHCTELKENYGAVVMFSYIRKLKAEEWKAILTFIVPILIIVVAYIWHRHQRITPKTPEHFSHVFLSCKSDILQTHANPLNRALKNIQLRTFYYVERENLGYRIEEKLQVGVKNSASAIIIFSKEFARSNWCLYELVLILERHRTSVYPIIPIYCDGVNYWDLIFENESIYQEALENHKIIYGEEKVNVWKEALKDVAGRVARRATGSESELTTFFGQVAQEIKRQIPPFVRVP